MFNVQSAGVRERDQKFYTTGAEGTKEQHWAMKAEARRKPSNSEPTITLRTMSTNIIKQHLKIQVRLMKTDQIVIEKAKDAVLHYLKVKKFHEEYSEQNTNCNKTPGTDTMQTT